MDTIGVITRIEPYSPEWYQKRIGCFTASEVYKLMTDPRSKEEKAKGNLSAGAHTYVLQKVHEKLTGKVKAGISNYATEWGVEHEPLARKWYAKLTGRKVTEPYLVFHESIPYFSCTPDNFVDETGLLEIKCPASGEIHLSHCFITNNEYFKKNHPDKYWQCVAQMSICGKEWCDFVSFDPRVPGNLGLFTYRVERDEEDVAELETRVLKSREVFDGYLTAFSA